MMLFRVICLHIIVHIALVQVLNDNIAVDSFVIERLQKLGKNVVDQYKNNSLRRTLNSSNIDSIGTNFQKLINYIKPDNISLEKNNLEQRTLINNNNTDLEQKNNLHKNLNEISNDSEADINDFDVGVRNLDTDESTSLIESTINANNFNERKDTVLYSNLETLIKPSSSVTNAIDLVIAYLTNLKNQQSSCTKTEQISNNIKQTVSSKRLNDFESIMDLSFASFVSEIYNLKNTIKSFVRNIRENEFDYDTEARKNFDGQETQEDSFKSFFKYFENISSRIRTIVPMATKICDDIKNSLLPLINDIDSKTSKINNLTSFKANFLNLNKSKEIDEVGTTKLQSRKNDYNTVTTENDLNTFEEDYRPFTIKSVDTKTSELFVTESTFAKWDENTFTEQIVTDSFSTDISENDKRRKISLENLLTAPNNLAENINDLFVSTEPSRKLYPYKITEAEPVENLFEIESTTSENIQFFRTSFETSTSISKNNKNNFLHAQFPDQNDQNTISSDQEFSTESFASETISNLDNLLAVLNSNSSNSLCNSKECTNVDILTKYDGKINSTVSANLQRCLKLFKKFNITFSENNLLSRLLNGLMTQIDSKLE